MTNKPPKADPEPQTEEQRAELRDFLVQAAVSLVVEDAAPSTPEAPPPPPPAPAPVRSRKVDYAMTIRRGILLGLVASLATVAGIMFWPAQVNSTVPDAVLGDWVTNSPKYPGRMLSVTATDVGFQTAGNMPVHPVLSVQTRPGPNGAERVIIEYQTASGPYTLDVLRNGETLAFTHQTDVVWTRRKGR
jgi:hypothetical protein